MEGFNEAFEKRGIPRRVSDLFILTGTHVQQDERFSPELVFQPENYKQVTDPKEIKTIQNHTHLINVAGVLNGSLKKFKRKTDMIHMRSSSSGEPDDNSVLTVITSEADLEINGTFNANNAFTSNNISYAEQSQLLTTVDSSTVNTSTNAPTTCPSSPFFGLLDFASNNPKSPLELDYLHSKSADQQAQTYQGPLNSQEVISTRHINNNSSQLSSLLLSQDTNDTQSTIVQSTGTENNFQLAFPHNFYKGVASPPVLLPAGLLTSDDVDANVRTSSDDVRTSSSGVIDDYAVEDKPMIDD